MYDKLTYIYRSILWELTRVLFVIAYINNKFGFKLLPSSDKIPWGPSVFVSNHGTFFDPWIVGQFSHRPVSIMMNEEGFKTNPFTLWYLKSIGAFPKKKGASDYKAMKHTIRMIKGGYSVLIFGEGQTTWDGETQPIFKGIEKIIKLANVNLVIVQTKGNFVSRPWWSKSFRRGKVYATIKVIKKADVPSMTEEQILTMITTHLYNNDLKDELVKKTVFRGKDHASGMERFIWICHHCHKEDTLESQGSTLRCTACGHQWSVSDHFQLTATEAGGTSPGDIHDYAAWHKQVVKKKISDATDETLLTFSQSTAMVDIMADGKPKLLATGSLSLTKGYLVFEPQQEPEKKLRIAVSAVKEYVFQRKDCFAFTAEGISYHFIFEDKSPMKWVYYFRYLNDYEACEKRGYY